MKNSFESPENTDYRNEQAEKLNDLRRTEGRSAAIEYLDILKLDPQYQEARREHKNILAKASNEKKAEEIMSNIEIKAALTIKDINILIDDILSAGGRTGREFDTYNGRQAEEARKNLHDAELMQKLEKEVATWENSGIDKKTILAKIKDRYDLLGDEFSLLHQKSQAALQRELGRYDDTYDPGSVISSWFDEVRTMMSGMTKIDSDMLKKERERLLYSRILSSVEKSDEDLNVSVIIKRLEMDKKQKIEENMQHWPR